MNIDVLSPLNPLNQDIKTEDRSPAGSKKSEKLSFGDTIKDFIQAVNDSQTEADKKVQDVIQGRSENLVEAMTALEDSSLSFQLMVEIRNKLLESFQEISRMQV